MSSFALATVALLVFLLAAIAFAGRAYLRSRHGRHDPAAPLQPGAKRYDSTLGELRDLREALGPLASAPARAQSRTDNRNAAMGDDHQPVRSAR